MIKIVNFMTISIIFIVLIVGCESSSTLDEAIIDFNNEESVFQTGEFHTYEVSIQDQAGEIISVDRVYLYMNMERMNHPMTESMAMIEDGVYSVDLPLAMEGEWFAEVTIEKDGEERTEQFPLYAEGEMSEDYMRGYDADTGGVPE